MCSNLCYLFYDSRRDTEKAACRVLSVVMYTDLPTFYEIKAEGKKSGRFFCSENIAIFLSAGDTE